MSTGTYTIGKVGKRHCSMWGSNSRPPDYETDALPTELIERAVDVLNCPFAVIKPIIT